MRLCDIHLQAFHASAQAPILYNEFECCTIKLLLNLPRNNELNVHSDLHSNPSICLSIDISPMTDQLNVCPYKYIHTRDQHCLRKYIPEKSWLINYKLFHRLHQNYDPSENRLLNGSLIMHGVVSWAGLKFAAMHYCDVILGTMASQITSLTIVYSTVQSENIKLPRH